MRFVSLKYRVSYVYTMIGKQESGNPSNRVSKSKGKSEHFQPNPTMESQFPAGFVKRRIFFVRCFSLSS